MSVEVQVALDKFALRWYQEEIWDTIEEQKSKRILYIASRRAGKDILFWNLAIRQCIKKTCLVFYVLPTYGQGRKAIFDAIAIDGTKFLDYLPPMLVEAVNQSEMKVRFKNGSILQIIGGDTYDSSLVGTNPFAVILSEYSLMPPDIFSFIRPILAANGGWCAIVGTPRGKNHLWHLYKIAQELPEWTIFVHKASEVGHIPHDVLAQERAQMDEGLYLQEYECSFDRGISGSFYGSYLDALKLKGQIGHVPWEPGLLTYTAWDIGVNDPTTIIFFNVVGDGSVIRIIDCYSNNNLGLDHYAKILQDKPYKYGKHFAPHDIKVREWGGGAVTRYEKARQLGIDFTLVDQVGIIDGIENVWTHFNKFWIDGEKCRSLINALENYRKEWDEAKQMYLPKPVKSWANHYADALRYMCMSLHKTKRGMSPEDFDRKKAQALYSNKQDLPRFFSDDPRYNSYR
jgi:phage terminase large subunit